jgi:hypothetical protein
MKYCGYKRHDSVKEDCFPFMPFRGPGPYLFRQSLFKLSPKSNIRITIKTFIKIIVQFSTHIGRTGKPEANVAWKFLKEDPP